jgi:ABC-type transporter Mla MlaB component
MPLDTEDGARLVLEGALTMRTVDAVRATLRAAIEPPSLALTTLSIDCAGATEIDLTFVQLLIAARVSAQGLGRDVVLAACPEGALLDTLVRGGFQVAAESGGGETPAFWFAPAGPPEDAR